MKIIDLQVGHLATNCYILYCPETLKAAVVDPGGNGDDIKRVLKQYNISVVYIINTHGHADHIIANNDVQNFTGAPIAIHKDDAEMLTNAQNNLSVFIGKSVEFKPADKLLSDGDKIEIGNNYLEVIHTPGHTRGGICLLTGNILISGDTLFLESVGRTDFPGGSLNQLVKSIKEKLMILPDDVKVLPGHGPATTIGWERKMNPYI